MLSFQAIPAKPLGPETNPPRVLRAYVQRILPQVRDPVPALVCFETLSESSGAFRFASFIEPDMKPANAPSSKMKWSSVEWGRAAGISTGAGAAGGGSGSVEGGNSLASGTSGGALRTGAACGGFTGGAGMRMLCRVASLNTSVVSHTTSPATVAGTRSFEILVQACWRPVYKHVRLRFRRSAEEAEDLTQGFFARSFELRYIGAYDPDRALFRTYLKICLDRFVSKDAEGARRHAADDPLDPALMGR